MKRIRLIELNANIKANIVAFLSIAMFVSLGIGLYLGIGWGAVALRNTGLETMSAGNMNDISVQFPYGITKSDLEKLKQVEGVDEVECGYTSYVVMQDGSNGYTLKMQSAPKSINKPVSIEGNLPVEKNEIALLKHWANDRNLRIGDVITLKHDARNLPDENGNVTEDKDGMEFLTSDTYTITAFVDAPEYLYKNAESLGVSNIGSGAIDSVGFITNDAFDKSKFRDGWSNVYIRCHSMDGKSVFTNEYKDGIAPIVDKITELGGTLGTARYNEIHDDAKKKLDDAQKKLDDSEKLLKESKQKITDGEKQLEEARAKLDAGEKELVDGVVSGSAQQNAAQIKLQEGYRQLANGQAKYDAGVAMLTEATDLLGQVTSSFDVRDLVPTDIGGLGDGESDLLNRLEELANRRNEVTTEANNISPAQSQSDVEGSQGYESSPNDGQAPAPEAGEVTPVLPGPAAESSDATGDSGSAQSESGDGLARTTSDDAVTESEGVTGTAGSGVVKDARNRLNGIADDINYTVNTMGETLSSTAAELEDGKSKLDSGWDEYYRNKAAYDAGVAEGQAKLISGQQELEKGKAQLAEQTKKLEEGKAQVADGEKKLAEGKKKIEELKKQFNKLEAYEWVVMPKQGNGTVLAFTSVSKIMDNVKWAMALLFIIVGLFVCYSAISRLVHEQITEIGTKKALGFRTGEVTAGYLAFSGLAVLLGLLVCVVLAVFLVQGIMNPTAARQFTIPDYGPHFDIVELFVVGGIELLLILASTWLAVRGLLKRHAIDLLRGESTANAKAHFYENLKIWQRMSLFSQTVINNCVNDKRRVIGTLVGVTGCTMLIVVAVTLQANISDSFTTHYNKVYDFDALTYLDENVEGAADSVSIALLNRGITSAPAYTRKLQVRKDDGTRNMVTLTVPTNEDSFNKLFKVTSTNGTPAEVQNGGLWISAAYASHQNVREGDEITLTEFNGKTHTFKVAGVYNYYLIRYEFVLSQNEYREAFGNIPSPNVLLTKLDGANIDRTRDALKEVKGFNALADDKAVVEYKYDELSRMMNTVIIIYLVLSALMALMVLLNLNIMFVNEKKRELIVLMICGYSTRAAKAYIYRDSIVLNVIGIVLGVILGAIIGGFTVMALEPEMAYWLKGFNVIAAIAGVVGAGVFSTAVLLWALRLIPRFDLTDINRF